MSYSAVKHRSSGLGKNLKGILADQQIKQVRPQGIKELIGYFDLSDSDKLGSKESALFHAALNALVKIFNIEFAVLGIFDCKSETLQVIEVSDGPASADSVSKFELKGLIWSVLSQDIKSEDLHLVKSAVGGVENMFLASTKVGCYKIVLTLGNSVQIPKKRFQNLASTINCVFHSLADRTVSNYNIKISRDQSGAEKNTLVYINNNSFESSFSSTPDAIAQAATTIFNIAKPVNYIGLHKFNQYTLALAVLGDGNEASAGMVIVDEESKKYSALVDAVRRASGV